jgi:replicative DNA helicase
MVKATCAHILSRIADLQYVIQATENTVSRQDFTCYYQILRQANITRHLFAAEKNRTTVVP